MVKNLVIASRPTPERIIILLIVTGLIYLAYPGLASSAALWLQPSDPSTTIAVAPTNTPQIEKTPTIATPRSTRVNQATADYLKALATADASSAFAIHISPPWTMGRSIS